MELHKYVTKIPSKVYFELEKQGIGVLRPSQIKAINSGLFERKNMLICTPTASGKTLVAELAILNMLFERKNKEDKAVYVVPLKALANEKHRQFSKKYPEFKVALTSGDMDSDDRYLINYDIIITTSEKMDSLTRHNCPWLKNIKVLVIDEIHLLNDVSRGPTLEVLITLLRKELMDLQFIGLSATIGNAKELSKWLKAELIEDSWRPVRLDHGVIVNDTIYFENK
ncbi:MAG: DEAD/DEAH box helicase [Candidatus Woesearchaeota archaeon]